MSYTVEIREVATGEIVTREYPYEWVSDSDPADEPGAGSLFWWTDGNFGCASNRNLDFWRGKGVNDEEVRRREAPCSCQEEAQPYIVRITLSDGQIVLDEFSASLPIWPVIVAIPRLRDGLTAINELPAPWRTSFHHADALLGRSTCGPGPVAVLVLPSELGDTDAIPPTSEGCS